MTAIELQSELLREINPIVDDEGLMRKVINYVRKLVHTHAEVVAPKEEIKANLRDAFAEFKEYQEGRVTLQSADELLDELRTL